MKGLEGRRIKWGYATHVFANPPVDSAQVQDWLDESNDPPCRNDVIVAEVLTLAHHGKLELAGGRRATLFPGDLVGVAYGYRYATRRWLGVVPPATEPCHLLTVAGVCGQVTGKVADSVEPTTLRVLGYLLENDRRVNLSNYGLGLKVSTALQPTTILVVGSAMDSGKTTAAASVIHGLTRSGASVCAAKLTGTAASKDIQLMEDAGALKVLDFTDVGHASTSRCSREQLWSIVTTIGSHLSALEPDYMVLEIADGLVQRETEMLMEQLHVHQYIDYTIYTCNDSLGVSSGVQRLRRYNLNVTAVSGWVACSPLAAEEAQSQTDVRVLRADELRDPSIALAFPQRQEQLCQRGAVG